MLLFGKIVDGANESPNRRFYTNVQIISISFIDELGIPDGESQYAIIVSEMIKSYKEGVEKTEEYFKK